MSASTSSTVTASATPKPKATPKRTFVWRGQLRTHLPVIRRPDANLTKR